MAKTNNILFCGVGGQGILLASEITALALLRAGLDVKKSEVHGMAQRGGSVVAHLRYGEKVYSPLIELGTVDIEVAFEMLESLRYLPYLKKSTNVIVNTQKILPLTVSTGYEKYPEGVFNELKGKGIPFYPIDAFEIGRSLGEVRAVNLAMVGALSFFLPIEKKIFFDIISEKMSEKLQEINLQAFIKGREAIEKAHQSEIRR